MTLVGFPDFQEQAQWQSPLAVEYSAALNTGATKSFPDTGPVYFNVSNWNATQLRISGAQRLDVELVWYDAIPATAFLARSYFTTPQNIASTVSFPNAGPYLQINVSNLSGVNDTLVAVVAFTNRRQQPFIVPSSAPMISVQNFTIAAGAFHNFDAAYSYAGPAHLWFFTPSDNWFCNAVGLTSNLTTHFFTHLGKFDEYGAAQDRHINCMVPPLAIQLQVTNNSAAAQVFYMSLTPDYFR